MQVGSPARECARVHPGAHPEISEAEMNVRRVNRVGGESPLYRDFSFRIITSHITSRRPTRDIWRNLFVAHGFRDLVGETVLG